MSFFYWCDCVRINATSRHHLVLRECGDSSTHGDDATDALSLQHVIKGLVDLREWHCVSYELLKLQLLFDRKKIHHNTTLISIYFRKVRTFFKLRILNLITPFMYFSTTPGMSVLGL